MKPERPFTSPEAAVAEPETQIARRPYTAPVLTTFGSVEDFTRGQGTSGSDGRSGRVKF
jgi:hypothetical protein